MNQNELYHHGVLGMKWGRRRYQNKDGSLTPAGRKRAEKLEKKYNKVTGKNLKKQNSSSDQNNESANKKKSIKEMSDAELRTRINRLQLEKQLSSLEPEQISRGKKIFTSMRDDVIAPALRDAGKKLLTDYLNKAGKKALKLDDSPVDPIDVLKKQVDEAELKKRKAVVEDYFRDRNKEKPADPLADLKLEKERSLLTKQRMENERTIAKWKKEEEEKKKKNK